jgi:hypothetical protein
MLLVSTHTCTCSPVLCTHRLLYSYSPHTQVLYCTVFLFTAHTGTVLYCIPVHRTHRYLYTFLLHSTANTKACTTPIPCIHEVALLLSSPIQVPVNLPPHSRVADTVPLSVVGSGHQNLIGESDAIICFPQSLSIKKRHI